MKVNDLVWIDTDRLVLNKKIGRVRKINTDSVNVKNGIAVGAYVYKESELNLIDLEKLAKRELIRLVNELI